jgi:hypothetical protein
MRNFTIARLPDKEQSFLHNNVRVHYVGTCPETGISLYCSVTHNYGVRVHPNGQAVQVNATTSTTPNSKIHSNAVRKQRYLQFKNAFGYHKQILVSHAVWMAAGRTIPEGMTMDHINGCTTDNRISNLRCISNALNNRDGGFLRKLRNKGIDPTSIQRNYLLRYYARMAKIKEALTERQYKKLDRVDLITVLFNYIDGLSGYFATFYNIQIDFDL